MRASREGQEYLIEYLHELANHQPRPTKTVVVLLTGNKYLLVAGWEE